MTALVHPQQRGRGSGRSWRRNSSATARDRRARRALLSGLAWRVAFVRRRSDSRARHPPSVHACVRPATDRASGDWHTEEPTRCPTFSFELYPAAQRRGGGRPSARRSIASSQPAPSSSRVTYGANGSLARRLARRAAAPSAQHARQADGAPDLRRIVLRGGDRLIREFLDAGVTSFLALRGDPPAGVAGGRTFLGDLGARASSCSSSTACRTSGCRSRSTTFPGSPAPSASRGGEHVTIAVAAFPNGHPALAIARSRTSTPCSPSRPPARTSRSRSCSSTPTSTCTSSTRREPPGVTMRILPGIMPVAQPARLARMLELTGESACRANSSCALDGRRHARGRGRGRHRRSPPQLARDLLDGGAPGIHLYTFNQHRSPARRPRAALGTARHRREGSPHDTQTTPTFPTGTILGLPADRPPPRAQAGRRGVLGRHDIGVDELEATAAGLRAATRERLAALGLGKTDSSIPESFSYYDQVLDAAVTVGAVPEPVRRPRRRRTARSTSAGYFTIARGEGDNAPLEMTKWFDSNYHYLVPEIGPDTDVLARVATAWCARSPRRRRPASAPARSSSGR